jgi:hypothetical protein
VLPDWGVLFEQQNEFEFVTFHKGRKIYAELRGLIGLLAPAVCQEQAWK